MPSGHCWTRQQWHLTWHHDCEKILDWLDLKPNTLDFHLAHPEVAASKYMQSRRLEIGRSISSKHRIYLDTKQWLQMRDVAIERPRNQLHVETFVRLESLCSSGKVVCPISCSVFDELMLQSDSHTRTATARVIDLFGHGCCCLHPFRLVERELMYFLINNTGQGRDLIPIIETVWTKVAFIYGDVMPVGTAFPTEIENAMQKSMDDVFMEVSVQEIVAHMFESYSSATAGEKTSNENLAKYLEAGKRDHAGDFSSFHDLFCAEVYGGLDALRETVEDVVVEFYRQSGFMEPVLQSDREMSGKQISNLIVNAFRHKKVGRALPQIHIGAALHAAARWDKTRKYSANDFEDYRHASVALPYYDCFCTERSLRHILCQSLLQLDKVYGTKVIASDESFLDHLNSLSEP